MIRNNPNLFKYRAAKNYEQYQNQNFYQHNYGEKIKQNEPNWEEKYLEVVNDNEKLKKKIEKLSDEKKDLNVNYNTILNEKKK